MAARAKTTQPERSFPFLRTNKRKAKLRTRGLTEIRGPYYSVGGRRYLEDSFERVGECVDSLTLAGGATAAAELRAEGTRDPNWAIAQAKRFLEAGADIIMIESEGITENVDQWRTYVPAKFIDEIGMDKLMFEAADPDAFACYIKNYGADVNLFLDPSQIVQLECLRAGIWGTKSLWGRVMTYEDAEQ